MAAKSSLDLDTDPRSIIGMREFDAPRDLVFAAWTDPKHLAQWWGPNGFTTTTMSFDLRPGGIWRFVMHCPDGRDYQNRITFEEIVPPELQVWEHSFSDKTGGLTRHPLSPTWPLKLLTRVTLEEAAGGKTKMTLRWAPLDATGEEQETFAAAHDSMQGGWTGTFDRFDVYLARIGAKG